MKKILIIGGCGYLGTSLYVYLKSIGYEVDTVDIELYGHPSNSKNIKKNYKLLTKSFLDKYGSIVLLAGHSTLGSCENDPADAFENNIKNFIDLLKKLKNQKFIYASTYRVYGNSNKKVSENSNLAFSNYYYDLMKIAIDNFAQISNKNYYSLRMATVNGFSPNLRTNQVINSLLLSAKKNNKIVAYNPKGTFSVLGINDFCRAVEAIISIDGKKGIYNLSSFDTSVEKICNCVKNYVEGVEIKYMKNNKIIQSCRINNAKFSEEFKFTFTDTLDSLIENLNKKRTHTKLIRDPMAVLKK